MILHSPEGSELFRSMTEPIIRELEDRLGHLACGHCGEYVDRADGYGGRFCAPCRKARQKEQQIATRLKMSETRECAQCSTPFTAVRSVKTRCCSQACAARLVWSTKAKGATQAATCRGCGIQFAPKQGRHSSFHSRQCAYQHIRLWLKPRPKRQPTQVVVRLCVVCEQPSGRLKTCSTECRRIQKDMVYQNFKASSRYAGLLKAKREATANDIACRSKRSCSECGSVFIPGRRKRHCSNRCLRKATKRIDKGVRNSRLRSKHVERVDPIAVFRRDKWLCQLCGIATPQRLRGTIHQRAPELDHIIPLAQGGHHSYENTQCACRGCNGRKGATALGQLRLM